MVTIYVVGPNGHLAIFKSSELIVVGLFPRVVKPLLMKYD